MSAAASGAWIQGNKKKKRSSAPPCGHRHKKKKKGTRRWCGYRLPRLKRKKREKERTDRHLRLLWRPGVRVLGGEKKKKFDRDPASPSSRHVIQKKKDLVFFTGTYYPEKKRRCTIRPTVPSTISTQTAKKKKGELVFQYTPANVDYDESEQRREKNFASGSRTPRRNGYYKKKGKKRPICRSTGPRHRPVRPDKKTARNRTRRADQAACPARKKKKKKKNQRHTHALQLSTSPIDTAKKKNVTPRSREKDYPNYNRARSRREKKKQTAFRRHQTLSWEKKKADDALRGEWQSICRYRVREKKEGGTQRDGALRFGLARKGKKKKKNAAPV